MKGAWEYDVPKQKGKRNSRGGRYFYSRQGRWETARRKYRGLLRPPIFLVTPEKGPSGKWTFYGRGSFCTAKLGSSGKVKCMAPTGADEFASFSRIETTRLSSSQKIRLVGFSQHATKCRNGTERADPRSRSTCGKMGYWARHLSWSKTQCDGGGCEMRRSSALQRKTNGDAKSLIETSPAIQKRRKKTKARRSFLAGQR